MAAKNFERFLTDVAMPFLRESGKDVSAAEAKSGKRRYLAIAITLAAIAGAVRLSSLWAFLGAAALAGVVWFWALSPTTQADIDRDRALLPPAIKAVDPALGYLFAADLPFDRKALAETGYFISRANPPRSRTVLDCGDGLTGRFDSIDYRIAHVLFDIGQKRETSALYGPLLALTLPASPGFDGAYVIRAKAQTPKQLSQDVNTLWTPRFREPTHDRSLSPIDPALLEADMEGWWGEPAQRPHTPDHAAAIGRLLNMMSGEARGENVRVVETVVTGDRAWIHIGAHPQRAVYRLYTAPPRRDEDAVVAALRDFADRARALRVLADRLAAAFTNTGSKRESTDA